MAMKRKVAGLAAAVAVPAMIAGMTPAVALAEAAPGTITIELGSEVEDSEVVLDAGGKEVATATVKDGVATFSYSPEADVTDEILTITVDGKVVLSDATCTGFPAGGSGTPTEPTTNPVGSSTTVAPTGTDTPTTSGTDTPDPTGTDTPTTSGTPDDGTDDPAAGASGTLASAVLANPGLNDESRKMLSSPEGQKLLDGLQAQGYTVDKNSGILVADGKPAMDLGGLSNILGPLMNGIIEGTPIGDILRPVVGVVKPILKPIIDIMGPDVVKGMLDPLLAGFGVPPGIGSAVFDVLYRLMEDPEADVSDIDPNAPGNTSPTDAPTDVPTDAPTDVPTVDPVSGESYDIEATTSDASLEFTRTGNDGVECSVDAVVASDSTSSTTSVVPTQVPTPSAPAPAPQPVSGAGSFGPKVDTGGTVDASFWAKVKQVFA